MRRMSFLPWAIPWSLLGDGQRLREGFTNLPHVQHGLSTAIAGHRLFAGSALYQMHSHI